MEPNKFFESLFCLWEFDKKAKDEIIESCKGKLELMSPEKIASLWKKLKTSSVKKPNALFIENALDRELNNGVGQNNSWWEKEEKKKVLFNFALSLRDIFVKKHKIWEIEDKSFAWGAYNAAYQLIYESLEKKYTGDNILDNFRPGKITVTISDVLELGEKNGDLWARFVKTNTANPKLKLKIPTRQLTPKEISTLNDRAEQCIGRQKHAF